MPKPRAMCAAHLVKAYAREAAAPTQASYEAKTGGECVTGGQERAPRAISALAALFVTRTINSLGSRHRLAGRARARAG